MGRTPTRGEAPSYSFQHPELGEIYGITRGEDVVQFRGIPFASIPARFRQSVLASALPQQPFDATKPGPTCPHSTSQPFPAFWEGPLASDGVVLKYPEMNEYECLNLNITAPKFVLEGNQQVPVLVYIHGGGFTVGCSSLQVAGREVYDGVNLVKRSIADGRPLVVVSINYRLGPLGFLSSKALEVLNRSHGEAVGNYGLHDQRQGIEWVSKFIGAFGGDASNITIQGGSAGGASCHFQAQIPDTKVKRAILSSGTTLALGAMPLHYHQERYNSFVGMYCPNDSPDGPTSVSRLQSFPVDELVNYPIGAFYYPLIDNEWIKGRTATALQKNPTSVELMVGSCAFEQDLTLAVLGAMDTQSPRSDKDLRTLMKEMIEAAGLSTKFEEILSPSVLEAYGVSDTLETPSDDLEKWANLLADMIFRVPPYIVGLYNTSSKVYVYDFQATNPYPGWPLGYQKSNHAISDVFLFNVAEDLVAERHQAEFSGAVRELQQTWTKFCYGDLNWEPFRTGDTETLGPVYALANHGKHTRYDSLEAALGKTTKDQWKAIINIAEHV